MDFFSQCKNVIYNCKQLQTGGHLVNVSQALVRKHIKHFYIKKFSKINFSLALKFYSCQEVFDPKCVI